MGKIKPVYMYDVNMNLIKKFESTQECADFFDKDRSYINHSLKYRDKIRKNNEWFRIKREECRTKQYSN